MTITICPRCNERIAFSGDDYIHTCNSGESVLDNESVKVIGNYVDEANGNTVVVSNYHLRGLGNKLKGARAGIVGGRLLDLNVHGKSTSTHRLRQHYEYVRSD